MLGTWRTSPQEKTQIPSLNWAKPNGGRVNEAEIMVVSKAHKKSARIPVRKHRPKRNRP